MLDLMPEPVYAFAWQEISYQVEKKKSASLVSSLRGVTLKNHMFLTFGSTMVFVRGGRVVSVWPPASLGTHPGSSVL